MKTAHIPSFYVDQMIPPAHTSRRYVIDRDFEQTIDDFVNSEGNIFQIPTSDPMAAFPLADEHCVGVLTLGNKHYAFQCVETKGGVNSLLAHQSQGTLRIRYVMTFPVARKPDVGAFFDNYHFVKHDIK